MMKRVVIAGILVLGVITSIELTARRYVSQRYHNSDPRVFYYPKLKGLRNIDYSEDTVKIGIFGNSVTATGLIGNSMQTELSRRLRKPVRIYNLSYIRGTIQDAWYLYKWGGKRRFQAIVVYQGITETLMNHALKRVTYNFSEISWFRRRQDVDLFYHPWFQTPCAIAYFATTHLEKNSRLYTHWNRDDKSYWKADSTTRNVAINTFSHTYRNLLATALHRNEIVFMVSCVYSLNDVQAVFARVVDEYNDSTRTIAREGGHFIDLSELTTSPELFEDVTHLNEEGQHLFSSVVAENISAAF